MKLNRDVPVDRTGNGYCGPLVIAALLGISTAEAASEVRRRSNRRCYARAVKGMYNDDLVHVLKVNGLKVEKQPHGELRYFPRYRWPNGKSVAFESYNGALGECTPVEQRPVKPTLARWLAERPDKSATYVVQVTGHYVLVSGRKFVDTHTRGQWVNIGDAPRRRKRVEHVWMIHA